MSMPGQWYSCTKCDFRTEQFPRPVSLLYHLPDGTTVTSWRKSGWCYECGGIANIEADINPAALETRIEELSRPKPLRSRLGSVLARAFGVDSKDPREQELLELQGLLRVSELRKSGPRCLQCGSENTEDLVFSPEGLSLSFVHGCGGRLRRERVDGNGPRLSFRQELVHLDVEGRKLPI